MIGIDILENERIKERLTKPEFMKMFMTDYEQKYVSTFTDMTQRVTGVFCAKEAIKKAFDCPDKMNFKTMEIRHFENGKPYVIFDKSLEEIVGNRVVEISISHSNTVTVAVCMVFEHDKGNCDCCDCQICECEPCDCEQKENSLKKKK